MAVDKRINYAIQGGGPNYLGKQKMVKAPKKWKSSPTHPEAHLAYITDKEQDLLIKKNLYGSLKGKPNRGPSGIVSLQGDLGGYSGGQGGGKSGGSGGEGKGGAGSGSSTPWRDTKQYEVLTRGQYDPKTRSFRDDRIARGAVPEYAYTPSGEMKYVGSKVKGKQGWISKLLGRGNVRGTGSLKFNPQTGRYESEDEELGDIKPGFGGRILGGLAGLATGIPFVGPMIGGAIDKGKGIFGRKPRDMTQYNKLGLFGQVPEDFEQVERYGVDQTPMESLTMANWGNPPEEDQNFNNQNFNMALPMGSAEGGRIGLYAGGDPGDYPENEPENIFQIMQEENIPFSEQVEGDPFDLRIQELMDKGLSYDDAYEIAEQEFQHLFSEGSEQDQGIASLV